LKLHLPTSDYRDHLAPPILSSIDSPLTTQRSTP
jgi:hypothetical protein